MFRVAGRERDAYDLRRVWRDLVTAFWFISPSFRPALRRARRFSFWEDSPNPYRRRALESRLEQVAYSWWLKMTRLRRGASSEELAQADRRIESDLGGLLFELRRRNQKAGYWLRREFGTDGEGRMAALRESIEPHLGSLRDARLRRATAPVEAKTGKSLALASLGTEPGGKKSVSNPNLESLEQKEIRT